MKTVKIYTDSPTGTVILGITSGGPSPFGYVTTLPGAGNDEPEQVLNVRISMSKIVKKSHKR